MKKDIEGLENVLFVSFGKQDEKCLSPPPVYEDDMIIDFVLEDSDSPVDLNQAKYYSNYFGDEVS
jgi:hypothetical protein